MLPFQEFIAAEPMLLPPVAERDAAGVAELRVFGNRNVDTGDADFRHSGIGAIATGADHSRRRWRGFLRRLISEHGGMLHAVVRLDELDEPPMLDKFVHDGGGHLVVAEHNAANRLKFEASSGPRSPFMVADTIASCRKSPSSDPL